MFRNEVTRLDAIAAILCVESSMTTSAIVDTVGNALHSNFTDNPDEECILHHVQSRYVFILNFSIFACLKSASGNGSWKLKFLHFPCDFLSYGLRFCFSVFLGHNMVSSWFGVD